MTQFEVIDLFAKLGYDCSEDNICSEVNDYDYYALFRSEHQGIWFRNRDSKLEISIHNFGVGESIILTSQLALAIAEQVKVILEEYKGEIE
jgi:hypothetical protein